MGRVSKRSTFAGYRSAWSPQMLGMEHKANVPPVTDTKAKENQTPSQVRMKAETTLCTDWIKLRLISMARRIVLCCSVAPFVIQLAITRIIHAGLVVTFILSCSNKGPRIQIESSTPTTTTSQAGRNTSYCPHSYVVEAKVVLHQDGVYQCLLYLYSSTWLGMCYIVLGGSGILTPLAIDLCRIY
jgi:hypothetical protein